MCQRSQVQISLESTIFVFSTADFSLFVLSTSDFHSFCSFATSNFYQFLPFQQLTFSQFCLFNSWFLPFYAFSTADFCPFFALSTSNFSFFSFALSSFNRFLWLYFRPHFEYLKSNVTQCLISPINFHSWIVVMSFLQCFLAYKLTIFRHVRCWWIWYFGTQERTKKCCRISR